MMEYGKRRQPTYNECITNNTGEIFLIYINKCEYIYMYIHDVTLVMSKVGIAALVELNRLTRN